MYFVDIVAAVPRYDDDTYSGRIIVYNPNDYQTIQSIEARGTQVGTCTCSSLKAGSQFDTTQCDTIVSTLVEVQLNARMDLDPTCMLVVLCIAFLR